MNIKEAKEQIKNAMMAYFTKDSRGNYVLPIQGQRPVFLMGPPGVGKTAIMAQIAHELDVGMVPYSMTHHTRQSALGLPYIEKKMYGGMEYSVSEYTMSEIIASVYEMIEKTGKKEGILFLDEINCVSETLSPAMLQFLQYKTFGKHRVPDGWIVVTAGNPPEYNNSVREFDIVTWDRLKRIDIEPDYEAWREYARNKGTHPSVLTYLEIKKDDFYKIETTVEGKSFVTARGWSDLSDMIILYEKNGITVDEKLIAQYLQNRKIAKSFAVYYDLFNKYKSDYQVDEILAGTAGREIKDRAKAAKFDERLALVGMILDALTEQSRGIIDTKATLNSLFGELKIVRQALATTGAKAEEVLAERITLIETTARLGKETGSVTRDKLDTGLETAEILEKLAAKLKKAGKMTSAEAFELLKADFDERKAAVNAEGAKTVKRYSNVFNFFDEVFGNGQEVLILVTDLTANYTTVQFLQAYRCNEYHAHANELKFYERQIELIHEIEDLEL